MSEDHYPSPFYRVLSVLLDYPRTDFSEILADAEQFLRSLPLPRPLFVNQTLAAIDWMRQKDVLDLQQIYVRTFDLTPTNSLHLTAHLLEEQDRRRGPALIKLIEHYRETGLSISEVELPDYLPAILEFASMLNEPEAARFLLEADDALNILEKNLSLASSTYALLITAIRQAAKSGDAHRCVAAVGAPS